ncbi:lipoprotein insertase outer membrane protein LolB [Thiobacter aerophilum]|uniref:Outer-membrane lipoprotein LolB n=1 Tax=Thiobacter aerophilum TaxID=3121275 RepID=A0ABV0EE70_9BURK
MGRLQRWAFLSALAWLTGCATTPPPGMPSAGLMASFHLVGRISVRQGEQGFSGSLDWWHRPAADELQILSPLGQGVARLVRGPDGVSLTTADGVVERALEAESLTERILGLSLPLDPLAYWVQAQPAPGPLELLRRDQDGRIAALEQQGWRIEYGAWRAAPGGALPGRITVEGHGLRLKLVVDAWGP